MNLKEILEKQTRNDLLLEGMGNCPALSPKDLKEAKEEFDIWNKNGKNVWERQVYKKLI